MWHSSTVASLAKVLSLGVLDALAFTACVLFVLDGNFVFTASVAIGALLLNALMLSRHCYPLRYLVPGLFFLTAMVVYPIGYTIYISLTNYSTGHTLTKQQAIEQFTRREFSLPQSPHFAFTPFLNEQGKLAAVLLEGKGEHLIVFPDGRWEPAEGYELVDADGDGIVDQLGGWLRMERRDIVSHISELQALRVRFEGGWLRMTTFTEFRLFLPAYRYDPAQDILVDQRTGKVYRPRGGQFIAEDGDALDPGWREYVGIRNFIRLVTTPSYRGPFFRVLLWTLEWSFFTVLFSFAMGLALAILFNDSKMKLRGLYRSLVILPWAIPSFISILSWRYGFFHTEFGLLNRLLRSSLGIVVPWLGEPFWARFSLILMNVWLTYPYMMAVSLGALQSIPSL